MAPTKERPATKTIATNREARHEYFVLEALETGVELKGTEVKSLRAGGVNLKDSWACARAKSSTTSVQMPPNAMPSAPSTVPLNPTAFTIDFRQHSCPETSKLTHTARCVLWGRKGFDGGSEAWAAGSSGGTALNSSKKLTDNNNYQLLAA